MSEASHRREILRPEPIVVHPPKGSHAIRWTGLYVLGPAHCEYERSCGGRTSRPVLTAWRSLRSLRESRGTKSGSVPRRGRAACCGRRRRVQGRDGLLRRRRVHGRNGRLQSRARPVARRAAGQHDRSPAVETILGSNDQCPRRLPARDLNMLSRNQAVARLHVPQYPLRTCRARRYS